MYKKANDKMMNKKFNHQAKMNNIKCGIYIHPYFKVTSHILI